MDVEQRARADAINNLLSLVSRARYLGGRASHVRLRNVVGVASTPRLLRIEHLYRYLVETSPRHICAECEGRGTIPDPWERRQLGGHRARIPCPTCDPGYGTRGLGWVEP